FQADYPFDWPLGLSQGQGAGRNFYAQRNDSEFINRGLDDTLWLTRAHSVGHLRQTMNVLGYALMVNGLTMLEHRRRAEGLQRAA
ncbi:MAG TPA: hypothetical protein VI541_03510, partial [Actinomycetota bacterium]|nr:hypothetical protein [Actinomycetota bacterium]